MKLQIAACGLLLCAVARANGQGVVADTIFFNVKSKPYIADTITITDRVMADGNHVHHEGYGKIYRDSEGRTRTETEATVPEGSQPFHMISIVDPIEGVMITLDDRHHTGMVNHYGEKTQSRPRPENNQSEPSNAVPLRTSPPAHPTPTQEDLGIQEIQGVFAQGVRYTTTIPAGNVGNSEPILVVGERWISDELNMTVLTKNDDPRTGTREYRVTNIQRAEPDPALFQIPADYKVKDNGAQSTVLAQEPDERTPLPTTPRADCEPNTCISKVLYLPTFSTARELQEVVNAFRSVLSFNHINSNGSDHTIALKGSPEQVAAAERLLSVLENLRSFGGDHRSSVLIYQLKGRLSEAAESERVLAQHPEAASTVCELNTCYIKAMYLPDLSTQQQLWDFTNKVRTAANMVHISAISSRHVLVIGGTSKQVAIAESLFMNTSAPQ